MTASEQVRAMPIMGGPHHEYVRLVQMISTGRGMRRWTRKRDIICHPHRGEPGMGFGPERASPNLTPPVGSTAWPQPAAAGSTPPLSGRHGASINGEVIRAFRQAASHLTDPDIRRFVIRFLEVGEQHDTIARGLGERSVASRSPVIQPPRTGDPNAGHLASECQ